MTIRFKSLDALRFILALYVVVGHLADWPFMTRNGGLAVDFFFVLSGFVLAQSIVTARHGWSEFFARRLARLWPLNLVTMLAVVAMTGITEQMQIFTNFLLLQNSGILDELVLNWPSWSISSEFVIGIFILWPVAYYRLPIVALMAATFGTVVLMQQPVPVDHMHVQPYGPFSLGLIRCMVGCLIGYLAYETFIRYAGCVSVPRVFATVIHLALLLSVVLLLSASLANGGKGLVILLFPVVILAFALLRSDVGDFLSRPGFAFLGTLSFGLYMWHGPIIIMMRQSGMLDQPAMIRQRLYAGDFADVPLMLACVLLSVGLAYVSLRLFERPGNRLVMALWNWPRAAGKTAGAQDSMPVVAAKGADLP